MSGDVEPRNWIARDKATGEAVARFYDGTHSEALEWLAEKYGHAWAYGTTAIPARFEILPLAEPNG